MSIRNRMAVSVWIALGAGCCPVATGAPKGVETLPLGALERAWSTRIEFGERGGSWARCDFSVMVPDTEDGVAIAGSRPALEQSALHGEPLEGTDREHAVFQVGPEGAVGRVRLGDAIEGRVIFLSITKERVVAATRFEQREGVTLGPETRVVVSVRPRLGVPSVSDLELGGTQWVFPLSDDRWLAVGAAPPRSVTTWTWRGDVHTKQSHPARPPDGTPAGPVEVHDVAAHGSAWAVRGQLEPQVFSPALSVFDEQRGPRWHILENAITTSDVVFDAAGHLWITAVAVGAKPLGAARFGAPLRLPDDVRKTREDQAPVKGHVLALENKIYSLYGDYLQKIRLREGRVIEPEDVVDGVVLRYSPEGALTVGHYYPSGALVWPGPVIADGDGVTAAVHIEGPVPHALRRHPTIADGFAGTTLLVHYDANGAVAWVQPLGEGERIVRLLTRMSDGYAVLAIDEGRRCELSRWRSPALSRR
jgi:hypothetical protein